MSAVLDPPAAVPPRVAPAIVVAAQLLGKLAPGCPVLFTGVTWSEYVWLRDFADEQGGNTRMTFDRGRLELMAPSFFHERVSRRLAQTVNVLSAVLKIPALSGGATTFERADIENGLEPDECFYIQNFERVRPLDEIDLSLHPPPDLAIEVDYTNSSIPKQPIYARLGIPELWRFDTAAVVFLIRQPDGSYQRQPNSRAFPIVNSAELSRFVMSHTDLDEGAFLLNCLSWATTTFATPTA